MSSATYRINCNEVMLLLIAVIADCQNKKRTHSPPGEWVLYIYNKVLLGTELLVHICCGTTTVAHSEDHGGTAAHDVAAGEDGLA